MLTARGDVGKFLAEFNVCVCLECDWQRSSIADSDKIQKSEGESAVWPVPNLRVFDGFLLERRNIEVYRGLKCTLAI